jgi:hypothetical protein
MQHDIEGKESRRNRILNVNLNSQYSLNTSANKAVCLMFQDGMNTVTGYVCRHHEKVHEEIWQIKQRKLQYFPIQ